MLMRLNLRDCGHIRSLSRHYISKINIGCQMRHLRVAAQIENSNSNEVNSGTNTLSSHQAGEDEVVPEAVRKPEEPEYIDVEVTTEVEIEYIDKGFQPLVALQETQQYLTGTNIGRVISVGAVGIFIATVVVAVQRAYQKANTVKAKRLRQIDRNKLLVTELSKYLPEQRFKLKPGIIGRLARSTGYSNIEVFRKYLWYVLRERKFDQEAVEDIVTVKIAAGLTDDDTAEALGERAQRIYDKYGTLMLNTDGFTVAGLERKATCKALFQKVLFLTECDALVKQGSEAAKKINLRVIFGATDEDIEKLRLVSLVDVDLEKAFGKDSPDKVSLDSPEQVGLKTPGVVTVLPGDEASETLNLSIDSPSSVINVQITQVSDDEADEGPASFETKPPQ